MTICNLAFELLIVRVFPIIPDFSHSTKISPETASVSFVSSPTVIDGVEAILFISFSYSCRYEENTNRRLQSIIAVLEPTLVIILSVIVGLILLSVILPLMGIMTSIG